MEGGGQNADEERAENAGAAGPRDAGDGRDAEGAVVCLHGGTGDGAGGRAARVLTGGENHIWEVET